MSLNIVTIKTHNLDKLHFELVRRLFQEGRTWIVGEGSYEGHKRLEFDMAVLHVTHPGTRPLAPIMPEGVPPVTDDDTIVNYCATYLMDDQAHKNEIYTYGQYIKQQMFKVVEMLKRSGGNSNQATMNIGGPESIDQKHPPCLRLIDCRVMNEQLHFFVYFRSWDLWGGLPENLGGLQLLKENMASLIGVEDGELIAMSKGLHLYDYSWPIALARIGGDVPEGSNLSKEEAELGEGWMVLEKAEPEKDTCPKCGHEIVIDEEQKELEERGFSRFPICPSCGLATCDNCNPGGRGCQCLECEETDGEGYDD